MAWWFFSSDESQDHLISMAELAKGKRCEGQEQVIIDSPPDSPASETQVTQADLEVDFERLTVKELRDLLRKFDFTCTTKSLKADLIERCKVCIPALHKRQLREQLAIPEASDSMVVDFERFVCLETDKFADGLFWNLRNSKGEVQQYIQSILDDPDTFCGYVGMTGTARCLSIIAPWRTLC